MVIKYIAWILYSLISAYKMLMLVRAICSWIPPVRDTKFFGFIHTITEPPLIPIRNLFHKISWMRNFPLDLSFLAFYILLDVVSSVLTIYM